ncbi:DUF3006 domain-containing protein [Sporomusa aerivorans]|uniref:DUF3006 domain-containing protein n=1 Tax=Sporomusa aerivorans TaxID=204936 RepID=UPI00352ABF99
MNIRAVVDRFEEDKAVLLVGEQETSIIWPRQLLPECRESDILAINITVDSAATQKAKQEVEDLFEQIIRQNNSQDGK